jgi:predicted dehydrogenase
MTGFNRRFAPLVRQLHNVLAECHGPKMIQYRVNAGPQPRDNWIYDPVHAEGRLIGEACHFIDLFRMLTGSEPIRVTATPLGECPSAIRLEDVSAVFEFADGSVATLLYTAQGSPLSAKESIEIFCDGTSLALDDFRQLVVRGSCRLDVRRRRIDKGHAAELQHFADALHGRVAPLIGYEDGIRATLSCLKLIESARQNAPCTIDLHSLSG